MGNENFLLAKEIFINYGGSTYDMAREGKYDYYKSFNISKEQELLWINEYQQEQLAIIENENVIGSAFMNFTFALRNFNDINYFGLLLEIVKKKKDKADTFSQMLMAEGILDIVESFCKKKRFGNKKSRFNKGCQKSCYKYIKKYT
jgi:hypothetical protein